MDGSVWLEFVEKLTSDLYHHHQTVVFHLSTQDFAVSLNFERSSKVQGRARRVHCSMGAVFSVKTCNLAGIAMCALLFFSDLKDAILFLELLLFQLHTSSCCIE